MMDYKGWFILSGFLLARVCDALNLGEVGVCPGESDREEKTRNVTDLVYEACGSGRLCPKNVTKTEVYYEEVPNPVCCEGFEWEGTDDGLEFCVPFCRPPCKNGRCIAPGKCHCDKPLFLLNNECIIPVCSQPCLNGQCTGPDTCTCNDGYYLKNNFTCAAQCTNCTHGECTAPNICECHKGYSMKEGKCMPECNTKCSNGYCSAPDVCSCNTGYKLKNGTCTPICNTDCVNANCVAPDVCECLDGYENSDEGICEPKCSSCVHGNCVAPNVCVCTRGYALIEGDCTPVCKEICVNGHCSAPDKCSCKDGYKLNETEPSVCYRPCGVCNFGICNLDGNCICDDELELVNGTCVLLTPGEAEASGIASTPGLAGLGLTWVVGGALCLLLLALLLVAINHSWRRRKNFGPKTADNGNQLNSVLYTVPHTLIRNPEDCSKPVDFKESDEEDTSEKLMRDEANDNV